MHAWVHLLPGKLWAYGVCKQNHSAFGITSVYHANGIDNHDSGYLGMAVQLYV